MEEMKSIADEYKKKLEADSEKDEVKTLGPQAWEKYRRSIQGRVEQFNAEMGTPVLTWDTGSLTDRFSVTRASDGRSLLGVYDEAAQTISLACEQASIDFKYNLVSRNGEVVFVFKDLKAKREFVYTPDETLYNLIRDFLLK